MPVPPGELPRLDRAVDARRAARGNPRTAVPLSPDDLARRPADRGRHAAVLRRAAIFLNHSGEPCYTGWTRRHQERLQDAVVSQFVKLRHCRSDTQERLRDAARVARTPQPGARREPEPETEALTANEPNRTAPDTYEAPNAPLRTHADHPYPPNSALADYPKPPVAENKEINPAPRTRISRTSTPRCSWPPHGSAQRARRITPQQQSPARSFATWPAHAQG